MRKNPWYLNTVAPYQIPINIQIFIVVAVLWTLPWKGIALWKSAKNGSKGWFITFLLIDTLGILEIIYIFYVNRKKKA